MRRRSSRHDRMSYQQSALGDAVLVKKQRSCLAVHFANGNPRQLYSGAIPDGESASING
jgi:hypothetical protein